MIKNKNILTIKNKKMSKKDTTIKQDTGLKRDTTDKYYTKLDIVEDCKVQIKKHINIKENDLIIEPSAGNGSFIKIIKELFIANITNKRVIIC